MIAHYLRDNPPKSSLTDIELETKLNNSIDIASIKFDQPANLFVTYIINCNGEDIDYKLFRVVKHLIKLDTVSELQRILLTNIQSSVSWSPAYYLIAKNEKQIEKYVDFQGAYAIRIDNNLLHILNEREENKYFKLKDKRRKISHNRDLTILRLDMPIY
jgi:hypothetical protein